MTSISHDTIWKKGEIHDLTDSILQIENGATLTIEGGVEVIGGSIHTFGTLNVTGSASEKVNFRNVSIDYNSQDPSYQSLINISHANIFGGTILAPNGNSRYGSLNITDSKIENLESYIYIWYPASDVHIERNSFIKSGGISTGHSDASVIIKNNLFSEQTTPFAVENWVSYGGSSTIVEFNSFTSTDRIALRLPDNYENTKIAAHKNYFGTTNQSKIAEMIYDKNDSTTSFDYINTDALPTPSPLTPSFDIPAPPVITFSPTDEAGNVAVNSNIVLNFNEAIARGTGNILLKTAAGAIVAT